MTNYFKTTIVCLFMSFSQLVIAGNCSTLDDGDWDDPTNWSCGYVPGSGDTIIIDVGDTILCETSYNGYTDVWLQVYGCLDFQNAVRYVFLYGDTATPISYITFYTGSSCINGNGSSGLSFGSGGSGCDIYRPAQGANPGVYPTIPGSYFDGCVWTSYLSVGEVWLNAEILDHLLFVEFELKEDPSILAYELKAEKDGQFESVLSFDARGDNQLEYYSFTTELYDYQYFILSYIDKKNNVEELMSLSVSSLIDSQNALMVSPNPFNSYINIKDEKTFEVQLYNISGKLIDHQSGASFYKLDTEDLGSGVYYLQIHRSNRSVEYVKVIKP